MRIDREEVRWYLTQKGVEPEQRHSTMTLLEPFYKCAETGAYELTPEAGLDPNKVSSIISIATNREVKRVVFISSGHPFPRVGWEDEALYKTVFEESVEYRLRDSLKESFGDKLELEHVGSWELGDMMWVGFMESFMEVFLGAWLKAEIRTRYGEKPILESRAWSGVQAFHMNSLTRRGWDVFHESEWKHKRMFGEIWDLLDTHFIFGMWNSVYYLLMFQIMLSREQVLQSSRLELTPQLPIPIAELKAGQEGWGDLLSRITPLVELLPKAIPLGEKKGDPGVWLVLVG